MSSIDLFLKGNPAAQSRNPAPRNSKVREDRGMMPGTGVRQARKRERWNKRWHELRGRQIDNSDDEAVHGAGDRTMMMQVLIVENDPQVATVLKDIVEVDQLHSVTGIACDLDGAMASIEACPPQLVLIDLHLAGNATGIEVAARARDQNVPTLFTTASPLPFPVPELALGCLCKPYSCYSVAQALRIAEGIIMGKVAIYDVPLELELY